MRAFKPKPFSKIDTEPRNSAGLKSGLKHGLTDEQHRAMLAEFNRRLLQFESENCCQFSRDSGCCHDRPGGGPGFEIKTPDSSFGIGCGDIVGAGGAASIPRQSLR